MELVMVSNDASVNPTLVRLKEEHRDLDDAITALQNGGSFDQLQLQRLKRRKLLLRDEITKIEDGLLPDIIA